jgi:hypothetical protein
MTEKEQVELARHLTRAVKNANTSRDVKEYIYSGFLDGMDKTEGYCDKNLSKFCNILDDVIKRRRRKL